MNDLISTAIAAIEEYLQGLDSCTGVPDLKLDGYRNGLQVAIQELKELSDVDVVPVVRCKDCAFWLCDEGHSPNGECRCGYLGGWWLPEEYCSGGKRREQTPQIVRCKNCKHYYEEQGSCDLHDERGPDGEIEYRFYVTPDWFCADGEIEND